MARVKTEAAEPISKMKMVKLAIQQHGDIGPKDMQAKIKEAHGVEIPTTMISSYKSNILRKQGADLDDGRDATEARIGIRDLTALQKLIDKVGASELQHLIKVLARK